MSFAVFTLDQKIDIKNSLTADTTELPFNGGNQALNTVFNASNLNAGDAQVIATYLNSIASPDFFGFPRTIGVDDIIGATIGQNFSEFVALTGNANTTNLHHNALSLLLRNGVIRPQNVEVRNALVSIFPAGTAPNTRSAILSACTRKANRVEKILALNGTGPGGGDGSAMNQSALLVFEGNITANDILDIKGIPS